MKPPAGVARVITSVMQDVWYECPSFENVMPTISSPGVRVVRLRGARPRRCKRASLPALQVRVAFACGEHDGCSQVASMAVVGDGNDGLLVAQ
eukprot:7197900-Prymnesium_polylepis.1